VFPGSRTAASTEATCGDSASASEYTATVPMPASEQERNTRRAISPRLATSRFSINVCSYIRKTPKPVPSKPAPLTGLLWMADKHRPSTVRVSLGSITPSS
jgi:hypothetical protein